MNTKQTAHTPTPYSWVTKSGRLGSCGKDGRSQTVTVRTFVDGRELTVALVPSIAATVAEAQANAAFIVRACNAHDDLVAALRNMMVHTHAAAYALRAAGRDVTADSLTRADEFARAALAKAGA